MIIVIIEMSDASGMELKLFDSGRDIKSGQGLMYWNSSLVVIVLLVEHDVASVLSDMDTLWPILLLACKKYSLQFER